MKERLNILFPGRQGMDELSKHLFWGGLAFIALAVLTYGFFGGFLTRLLFPIGLIQLFFSFYRAFSRTLGRREVENDAYIAMLEKRRSDWNAFIERCRQSRDFKFFRCPACKKILRVPRGKSKIHIKCRCGYTLYRKT